MPVLTAGEARELLDAIETDMLIGLRDRALICLMVYTFARVGAALKMRVEDYFVQGRKAYSVRWENSRGVAAAITGIPALSIGFPVGVFGFGGMGQTFNPPPPPGCYPVFLGSDSEGKFGRQCPACASYWRSDSWTK